MNTQPRITSQASACDFFQIHPKTLRNWITSAYITGYQHGSDILVDIDEIERELKTNPHMRDGRRKRYGERARIVPLPVSTGADR